MSDTIAVEAVVKEFRPNAMHDNFGSGGFAWYDATQLEILAPAQWRGTKLTIYHSESPEVTSPWRELDRTLRFSISEDDLKGESVLFDGAVTNLQV
jgi:hypothetical protein